MPAKSGGSACCGGRARRLIYAPGWNPFDSRQVGPMSPNQRSTKMSMTKRVLLASGATLALASAARAQGQPQGSNQAEDVLLDHQAVQLTPAGRHRKIKI